MTDFGIIIHHVHCNEYLVFSLTKLHSVFFPILGPHWCWPVQSVIWMLSRFWLRLELVYTCETKMAGPAFTLLVGRICLLKHYYLFARWKGYKIMPNLPVVNYSLLFLLDNLSVPNCSLQICLWIVYSKFWVFNYYSVHCTLQMYSIWELPVI